MARFVIAGISDCPRFALIEVVADELQTNLPDFRIHKIMKDKAEWPKWLQGICQENGWCHRQSPIVWRELIERGSKGELIGNASDFLEYVHAYYGPPATHSSRNTLRFAYENKLEYDSTVARNKTIADSIDVTHVCVMPACSTTAQLLLMEITSGRILFGNCCWDIYDKELADLRSKKQMVVHIYCHRGHELQLCEIREEILSLSRPMVRDVVVATDYETAFQECSLVILVEERGVTSTCELEPLDDKMTLDLLMQSDMIKSLGTMLSSLRASYMIHREVQPGRKISKRICFRKKRSSVSGIRVDIKDHEKSITSAEKGASLSDGSLEKSRKALKGKDDVSHSAMDSIGMSVDTLLSFSPVLSLDEKRLQNVFLQTTLFKNKWQRIVEIGRAITLRANPKCKVLFVGDARLNFLAYVLAFNFPNLARHIVAVTDLENRARGLLASKLEVLLHEVEKIHIWGDPADAFFVDVVHGTVENADGAVWKEAGFEQSFKEVFPFWRWLHVDFKKELQQFQAHRQKLKGCRRSCLPLVNNAVDVLEKWLCPENLDDDRVHVRSVGVPSNGLYDIPEDFVLTCPVILFNGSWRPVSDLRLPHLSKDKINQVAEKCLRMQYMYKLCHYMYDESELDLEWSKMLSNAGTTQEEVDKWEDTWQDEEQQETKAAESAVNIRNRDYFRDTSFY